MNRDADALRKSAAERVGPSLPTPGPWVALRHQGDGGVDVMLVTAGGASVAMTGGVCYIEQPQATREANARLIAAAPAMLEFLRVLADDGWLCFNSLGGNCPVCAARDLLTAHGFQP